MAEVPGNIMSAVSAVGRGELTQIRIIVEGIYEALDEASGKKAPQASDVSSVEPVEPLADDAKTADIRDAVIELAERFNQLVEAMKKGNA